MFQSIKGMFDRVASLFSAESSSTQQEQRRQDNQRRYGEIVKKILTKKNNNKKQVVANRCNELSKNQGFLDTYAIAGEKINNIFAMTCAVQHNRLAIGSDPDGLSLKNALERHNFIYAGSTPLPKPNLVDSLPNNIKWQEIDCNGASKNALFAIGLFNPELAMNVTQGAVNSLNAAIADYKDANCEGFWNPFAIAFVSTLSVAGCGLLICCYRAACKAPADNNLDRDRARCQSPSSSDLS